MKLPEFQLESETFFIRSYKNEDSEQLYAFVKSNLSHLQSTFPHTVLNTVTAVAAKKYIKEKRHEAGLGIMQMAGIFEKSSQRLIGHLVITKVDKTVPKCELGYALHEKFRGRGIATAAVGLLVNYLFEALHFEKITLRIAPDNKSSIALAVKLRAHYVGTAKHDFKAVDGSILDSCIYELYAH